MIYKITHSALKTSIYIDSKINIDKEIKKIFFGFTLYKEYDIVGDKVFKVKQNKSNICVIYKEIENIFGNVFEALVFISDYLSRIDLLDYSIFHGSVVLNDLNEGVCLVGATLAGKTTLSLFLAKNGFKYFSDDSIIIKNDNLECFSMQLPIKIRRGVMWGDPFFKKYIIHENSDFKIIGNISKNYNNTATKIKTFLFLNRCETKKSIVKKIDDFSLLLMENATSLADLRSLIKICFKINKKANGFLLTYNSLNNDLIKIIKEL